MMFYLYQHLFHIWSYLDEFLENIYWKIDEDHSLPEEMQMVENIIDVTSYSAFVA
jgi:hypothetical protein